VSELQKENKSFSFYFLLAAFLPVHMKLCYKQNGTVSWGTSLTPASGDSSLGL
jgi:hypothetical protein